MQLRRNEIEKMNLSWVRKNKLDVRKLRKWRLKSVNSPDTQISIRTVKRALKKISKKTRYNEIYDNLFSSISRPNFYPYGIEIDGLVRIPPFWAMYADLIYFTEIEGATKLKKLEKIKTTEFERNTVPDIFKELGFDVVPGHKEIENGQILFEIDSFCWDKVDTLWVIESKSKNLHRRFMESYNSWLHLCREWVERPKRRFSYPQVIELIKERYKSYQKRGIIPKDWNIKRIKGMVVSQIPPFEEIHLGISILWYKEIHAYFS